MGDSTAGKPKFWAGSQDGFVKSEPHAGEYGFVRTVSL
jgi:hypothetical protein